MQAEPARERRARSVVRPGRSANWNDGSAHAPPAPAATRSTARFEVARLTLDAARLAGQPQAGKDLDRVRGRLRTAWTVDRGATAPQAAGAIHTDFERGFIAAEIIAYDDYVRLNGEQGAKEAGRMRLEGRDYVVQDGDVCHFRFNV